MTWSFSVELVKTLLGAAKREELIGAKKALGKAKQWSRFELEVKYCRKVGRIRTT